ncbi:MAG: fibronectin type III domain-containing protein, partial [Planctomycetota bacterium]
MKNPLRREYKIRLAIPFFLSLCILGSWERAVAQTIPPAPASITVPPTSSTGNYTVSWTASAGAPLYELEESTDAGFVTAVSLHFGSNTTFQVTGRVNGTYYYRVRAMNSVGMSAWTDGSNPCTVTMTQAALHVDAGEGNPGASNEISSATSVPMLHIRVSAGSAESIRVLSLRVNAVGSGDDSIEVTSVGLVRDVDNDGEVDPGDVPVALGRIFGSNNGFIDFDVSGQPLVPAGGITNYIVIGDFSASLGSTFSFSVGIPADVNCQGALSMAAVTPSGTDVVGGMKTIASVGGPGSLSVYRGGNTPFAGQVFPPTSAPMIQIRLATSSMESVNVTRLKFMSWGTGDESLGITARLLRDMDGDGQESGGDVVLGTGTVSGDNGAIDFTGLTELVPAASSIFLLLVYDFDGSSRAGTYGVYLEFGQDIESTGVVSSSAIPASGTPLAGSLMTIPTPVFPPSPPSDDDGSGCSPVGGSADILGMLLPLLAALG